MTTVQVLFLTVWVLFYGAYLLKMLLLRRQGVRADILGRGEKPKRQAVFEAAIKIVTYLGAGVQAFSIAFSRGSWTPIHLGGLALAALGDACFLMALVVMGRNWRAGYSAEQDTKLVTEGIYRFSRNPAFLGFDLLYLGCALAFPNPVNLAFAVLAVLLFHIQILGEERFLADAFGQDYLIYTAKTMRYLGRRRG